MRLSLDTRARRLLRRLPVMNVYSALELLLLTLLALQAARLVWAAVTPVGPVGEWKVPDPLGGRAVPSLALGDFDPFFRLSTTTSAQVVVTTLAVQLFGVRVDRASGRDSAILSTPDGIQSSYAVGDAIVPGVTLAAVREDGVTLDRSGVREQLFLDQSIPAANATPAGAASAGAGFVPRIVNGQVSGLTVSASPGPVLEAAGLRAGDVIVSLNGAAINSAADAQQLAGGLIPGSRVSVNIERGGRVIPLTVEVPAR